PEAAPASVALPRHGRSRRGALRVPARRSAGGRNVAAVRRRARARERRGAPAGELPAQPRRARPRRRRVDGRVAARDVRPPRRRGWQRGRPAAARCPHAAAGLAGPDDRSPRGLSRTEDRPRAGRGRNRRRPAPDGPARGAERTRGKHRLLRPPRARRAARGAAGAREHELPAIRRGERRPDAAAQPVPDDRDGDDRGLVPALSHSRSGGARRDRRPPDVPRALVPRRGNDRRPRPLVAGARASGDLCREPPTSAAVVQHRSDLGGRAGTGSPRRSRRARRDRGAGARLRRRGGLRRPRVRGQRRGVGAGANARVRGDARTRPPHPGALGLDRPGARAHGRVQRRGGDRARSRGVVARAALRVARRGRRRARPTGAGRGAVGHRALARARDPRRARGDHGGAGARRAPAPARAGAQAERGSGRAVRALVEAASVRGFALAALRRLRFERGASAATLVVVAGTAFLFGAMPRAFDRVSERGLHYTLEHADPLQRNFSLVAPGRERSTAADAGIAPVLRQAHRERQALPSALAATVSRQTTVVSTPRYDLVGGVPSIPNVTRILTLRLPQGIEPHIRLASGRWPAPTNRETRVSTQTVPGTAARTAPLLEVVLSRTIAKQMRLHVGDHLVLFADQ